MSGRFRVISALLAMLTASGGAAAQEADARAAFVAALGQFSVAVSGERGGDRAILLSSLEAMEAALTRWDATVRGYETAMAAEIGTADPPLAARMHVALGAVYLDRGRTQDALAQFELARALDPSHADVPKFLQAARRQAAYPQMALVAERPNVEPFFPPPAYAAGFARLLTGDYGAAIASLKAAIAREPGQTPPAGSGEARYARGRAHQRNGNYEEAIRELTASLAFTPWIGANGIYQAIGAMAAARQNFDAAIAAYLRRLDLVPDDPEAHQDLGEIYLRQGRHEEALAMFATVLRWHPTHVAGHAAAARTSLALGNFLDAADSARRALAIDAGHKEARYVLATSLIRLGRVDEGTRELAVYQRLQDEETALRRQIYEAEGKKREAALDGR